MLLTMPSICTTLAALLTLACNTRALDNGLGQKPALGWNSWNTFKDLLDEKVRI
jgi:hypothetical protein